MSNYIGVRAYNRSQKVRIGQQTVSATTTTYIDVSDQAIRRDLAHHTSIGGLYIVAPLRTTNKAQGIWSGATVTQGTSAADRSIRALAGELRKDDGTFVTIAQQDVDVTNAHATLDRIDTVVVSTSGVASVVPGTAAATPVAPDLTTSQTELAQVDVVAAGGTDEVQSVTVDATSGTYTLTFNTQTTATIAFDASATTGANSLRAKLEALSNIAPGDVVVAGGPGDDGGTTPYTVTFGGQYDETNVSQMTADDALLVGGGSSVVVATSTPGVPVGIANADITDTRERVRF